MRVRIENDYADGHHSERVIDVAEPLAIESEDDDFWLDVILPETGDGHGIDNDLGAIYTATIIEAENQDFVGLSTEFDA